MKKLKLELILEKGKHDITGRLSYRNNLIVETAVNVHELELKMKNLLNQFEDIDPNTINFEHYYDVCTLFEQFNFLKISKLAEYTGISAGLLRQYSSQLKYPSAKQAQKIEHTIHKLAKQMLDAHICLIPKKISVKSNTTSQML